MEEQIKEKIGNDKSKKGEQIKPAFVITKSKGLHATIEKGCKEDFVITKLVKNEDKDAEKGCKKEKGEDNKKKKAKGDACNGDEAGQLHWSSGDGDAPRLADLDDPQELMSLPELYTQRQRMHMEGIRKDLSHIYMSYDMLLDTHQAAHPILHAKNQKTD
ncbi:hypothetical protein CEK25_008496 [Fusarium fujikuroi]|nr:hypothetical protein CEK25_008496 [Fusarium fujikuroi]